MERSAQPDPLENPRPSPSPTERKTVESPPLFKHSPLDHQAPSVRLIHILQDLSPEGYIRCEIQHASTDSKYVCLSHVWGEEDPGHWIVLDNRRFWIRDNLWHFLQAAWQKPHIQNEWLWIDALCIGQGNGAERNHQVQQMGSIFSSAQRVICWLGASEKIEWYLNCVLSGKMVTFWDGRPFFNCEYWNRAWITQEFALARQKTFMAGAAEIKCGKVPFAALDEANYEALVWSLDPNVDAEKAALVNSEMLTGIKGKCLIYLIEMFGAKDCKVPVDRIFSLLGICGDGSDLKVDYDSTPHELAGSILRACKQSFCICSARLIGRCLDFQGNSRVACNQNAALRRFAYTTLPVVVHTQSPTELTLSSNTFHVYPATASNGSSQRISLKINLYDICEQFYGTEIIVNFDSTTTLLFNPSKSHMAYRFKRNSPFGDKPPETPHPAYSCTGRFHHDSTLFTISCSLDMLLELARPKAVFHSRNNDFCCPKNINPNIYPYERLEELLLRLY